MILLVTALGIMFVFACSRIGNTAENAIVMANRHFIGALKDDCNLHLDGTFATSVNGADQVLTVHFSDPSDPNIVSPAFTDYYYLNQGLLEDRSRH